MQSPDAPVRSPDAASNTTEYASSPFVVRASSEHFSSSGLPSPIAAGKINLQDGDVKSPHLADEYAFESCVHMCFPFQFSHFFSFLLKARWMRSLRAWTRTATVRACPLIFELTLYMFDACHARLRGCMDEMCADIPGSVTLNDLTSEITKWGTFDSESCRAVLST